jgi:mannose-1-phosphate guanylyltransferase
VRALVLAGGKATRLRPLTHTTPKAMTPLLTLPFLEHVLAWLSRYDVRDVTLLLGFLPDPIRAYFGDGARFGVRLSYLVESEPLGSGGAIKQLEHELTEPFFALNGDIFTDVNLSVMAEAHHRTGAEVSMFLHRVEDPSMYGVVALDDAGWIRRFVEKPPRPEAPSDLINAGVWLFDPSAVGRIPSGRFTMVEQDLFPGLAEAGRIAGYAPDAYWMDAGTPDRYLQLQRDLLLGRASGALPLIERPGWPGLAPQRRGGAGADTDRPPHLADGATLEGPVVLDHDIEVAANAHVVGPASIGAGSALGAGSAVIDSLLWERCVVGERAAVHASVLATGCRIGDGARVTRAVLGEDVTVRPGVVVEDTSVEPGEVV